MSIRETCRLKESFIRRVWISKEKSPLLDLLLLHSGLTFGMSVSRSRKINEGDGAVVLTGRLGSSERKWLRKRNHLGAEKGSVVCEWRFYMSRRRIAMKVPHDKPAVRNYRVSINQLL
jgi:hypothetical protein